MPSSLTVMQSKTLILLIFIASFFGYLEWGGENSTFLYQAEWAVFEGLFRAPLSILHPLTVIPIIGQVLLIIAMLRKNPPKYLVIIGIVCIAILFLLMLFVGLLELNWKIILSTFPFLIFSTIMMNRIRRSRKSAQ